MSERLHREFLLMSAEADEHLADSAGIRFLSSPPHQRRHTIASPGEPSARVESRG